MLYFFESIMVDYKKQCPWPLLVEVGLLWTWGFRCLLSPCCPRHTVFFTRVHGHCLWNNAAFYLYTIVQVIKLSWSQWILHQNSYQHQHISMEEIRTWIRMEKGIPWLWFLESNSAHELLSRWKNADQTVKRNSLQGCGHRSLSKGLAQHAWTSGAESLHF